MLLALPGLLSGAVSIARAQDIYLETWAGDDFTGSYRVFTPGDGDIADLGDYGWNDEIRSLGLHGPPGTTIWLYDKKNFETNDDILEVQIPDGATSAQVPRLDGPSDYTRREVYKNGIAGKVSGIRWTTAPASSRFTVRLEQLRLVEAQGDSLLDPGNEPYFVVLSFKSQFGAAGSTVVRWSGYLDDQWAKGIAAGETRDIPPQMGQVVYSNLDTDSRFQILGVVVVAMEHDGMPWRVVRNVVDQVAENVRSELINLVETQNFTPAALQGASERLKEFGVGFWDVVSVLFSTLGNKDDLVGINVMLFVHPSFKYLPSISGVAVRTIDTQTFTLSFSGSDSVYEVPVSTDYTGPE